MAQITSLPPTLKQTIILNFIQIIFLGYGMAMNTSVRGMAMNTSVRGNKDEFVKNKL
jgi:hypothetical protein